MADERDPEKTLDEWKAEMQAEHEDAIQNPDTAEDHQIEGVSQVNYRVYYAYDPDEGLRRTREEQVDELTDPELRSCTCGIRGMTPEEAEAHVGAAYEQS